MLQRRGFTVFEITIALGLGLLVFGMAAIIAVGFLRDRELAVVTQTAVSYLRTAHMRAMESEGNTSHGFSSADGKLTLFRGSAYASRQAAYDTVWPYTDYMRFTGLSEVVFSKQSGIPSASGNIGISDGDKTFTVRIYPTGAVSQQ